MDRLFIYGTLAPGRPNHHVMQDIPGRWQAATLNGNLLDRGWGSAQGCPGIVPSEDGEPVPGFVFTSPQLCERLPMLDDFEGDGYRRVVAVATLVSGEQVQAYVYALNLDAV